MTRCWCYKLTLTGGALRSTIGMRKTFWGWVRRRCGTRNPSAKCPPCWSPTLVLETGLHYWSAETKEWLDADPSFSVNATGDAFVANRTLGQLRASAQINTAGAITRSAGQQFVPSLGPQKLSLLKLLQPRPHNHPCRVIRVQMGGSFNYLSL